MFSWILIRGFAFVPRVMPSFAYLEWPFRRVRRLTCPWSVAILYLVVSSAR